MSYDTWPKNEHGRLICNAVHPMPKDAPTSLKWVHPEAEDDGSDDPYYDGYECPNCGLRFKVEVAE